MDIEQQTFTNEQVRQMIAQVMAPPPAVGPIQDIRPYIPLVDATNPAKFPKKPHQAYPKMMLRKATKEDITYWKSKNEVSDDRGNIGYRGTAPKVGTLVPIYDDSGNPVIVHSPEEEERFAATAPDAIRVIEIAVPHHTAQQLKQLEEENARLRALLEDNAALKAQMAQPADEVIDLPASPLAGLVKNEEEPAPRHKGKKPPLAMPD